MCRERGEVGLVRAEELGYGLADQLVGANAEGCEIRAEHGRRAQLSIGDPDDTGEGFEQLSEVAIHQPEGVAVGNLRWACLPASHSRQESR